VAPNRKGSRSGPRGDCASTACKVGWSSKGEGEGHQGRYPGSLDAVCSSKSWGALVPNEDRDWCGKGLAMKETMIPFRKWDKRCSKK